MRITEAMVRAGAQAEFEMMNGRRPTDPDKFDSPEDFVEQLKWWDSFYADAFPRYCANFRVGLEAALRASRKTRRKR